jgi:hypothetical protein
MYIRRKSADEYFNAVGGPKEQKWYFTSHEFNDQESRSDRASWRPRALGLNVNSDSTGTPLVAKSCNQSRPNRSLSWHDSSAGDGQIGRKFLGEGVIRITAAKN